MVFGAVPVNQQVKLAWNFAALCSVMWDGHGAGPTLWS